MNDSQIFTEFKKRFGHLKKFGLQIHGIANLNTDHQVISISTPFIFDHRQIPKRFMGLDVRNGTTKDELPEEFQNTDSAKGYIWAYQRFEKFVEENADLIRRKLDSPEMTNKDMLDAICFGDFEKHKEMCRNWESEGRIPKWNK